MRMKEASSGRLLGCKGQMKCAHKMSVPPNRKIRRGTPYFEATFFHREGRNRLLPSQHLGYGAIIRIRRHRCRSLKYYDL